MCVQLTHPTPHPFAPLPLLPPSGFFLYLLTILLEFFVRGVNAQYIYIMPVLIAAEELVVWRRVHHGSLMLKSGQWVGVASRSTVVQ